MAQEERETMELDVLFIGAGPANLSAAYRLKKNIDAHNIQAKSAGGKTIDEPMILVIDKGSAVGSHTLSGADVDPIAFRELFPELKTEDYPFMAPVVGDETYFLTATGKIPVPGFLVPPEMHSTGCHIGSISEMCRWLAKKCEEVGVEVYTEFAATELIREGEAILGAKIGDKGLDKDGNPGEGFAPGMDLMAKVTVLGEGTRGYLADQLISDFRLNEGADPQVWGLGLKEIIEIPAGRIRRGQVIHTFGYPLDLSTYGGSFVYALSDTLLSVGLVFGLDYKNPLLHSHDMFLKLKGHPLISSLIAGGKVLEYGAKTLPEGGLSALPKLSVNGAVLVGDSAGFLTTMRLKGVHLAMKSGMMAADRISRALVSGDFSAASLDYRQDFDVSWGGKELQRSRDFRQGFHGGLIAGMMNTGLGMFTGGALSLGRHKLAPDCETLRKVSGPVAPRAKFKTDENLYLDILTDVYKSGSVHREHQPPHCHIPDPALCLRCHEEFASPCTRFCPAEVYEALKDDLGRFTGIQVNFSNCVHCKTCEIKDPMRNVKWTPPEGGDGPKYQKM